ncbi:hypothetical protein Rsub_00834 [Raphidocelis subcapitata]|uniref:Uncharacterized protein n=1 Tax=Raphidocelis subcapitata TaxID=307507 RepID=A0A2V0NNP5_9CHLO|nr:hypothetical protein Rsub_00834 [Raphidocelis subcapitata]|eukprot:GBF88122.1 hypothetical protein Rsub_00834 [Raphidocelis subcapitata]
MAQAVAQPAGGYDRGADPGAARRGFRGTAENAKTKLCQRWANGDCRFGDRCNFAHGEQELRSLPPRGDAGYGRGGAYGGPPGAGGYGGAPGWGAPGGFDPAYAGYAAAPAFAAYPPQQLPGGMRPYSGPPGGVEDVYARQGFPVQGPNGWVAYRTQDTGETYYHNHASNVTQWDRPADWPSAP